eukprot:TRINITY_DN2712_c0_g4_i1.p1 TRINITY_DN2712_c0_g4~~TRINITY_DN2712_c0_g4_i1.p1  ORF type:complete len:268 (+),score=82.64 TRINITY_DN2712_c0_g4_i1:147-950(+)
MLRAEGSFYGLPHLVARHMPLVASAGTASAEATRMYADPEAPLDDSDVMLGCGASYQLTEDVWPYCMSFLDVRGIARCAATCSALRRAAARVHIITSGWRPTARVFPFNIFRHCHPETQICLHVTTLQHGTDCDPGSLKSITSRYEVRGYARALGAYLDLELQGRKVDVLEVLYLLKPFLSWRPGELQGISLDPRRGLHQHPQFTIKSPRLSEGLVRRCPCLPTAVVRAKRCWRRLPFWVGHAAVVLLMFTVAVLGLAAVNSKIDQS